MWNDKKICIVGTGGVGGYFGGKIAKMGYNVIFLARGKTLSALREHGLIVESVDGDFTINPVNVESNAKNIGEMDLVIVCVKSHQIDSIIHAIKPLIGKKSLILPLQNGVEAPARLESVYSNKNVIGGSCKVISTKYAPGIIQHSGVSIIEIGELHESVTERVNLVKKMLDSAGIQCIAHDNFPLAQWAKMVFICGISGVTAMTSQTIGQVRSNPNYRKMIEDSVLESIKVANALNINLKPTYANTVMKWIDSMPENSTTSLQRDIKNQIPSEFNYLVGAIVRLGQKNNVDTPVNQEIYSSLFELEKKSDGKEEINF